MAYIDLPRMNMISEILRTARTRELKQQQQADSLRPGTPIGQSEIEDLNRAVEGAEFYTEVLSSQTEDEECDGDPNNQCDDADCLCHIDCQPTECDTCLGAYIDQAEREADAAEGR